MGPLWSATARCRFRAAKLACGTPMALLLPALVLLPGLLPAYTLFGERTVNRRWPEPAQVTFFINESGTPQIPFGLLRPAIVAGMDVWSQVDDSSLAYIDGGNTTAGWNIGDNQNTITFINEDFPFSSGIVAFSQTAWYSSGPNVDLTRTVDIVLNGQHHVWSVDGSPAGSYDVTTAVAHEAGHMSGLDHSPVRGATMYWQLTPVNVGGASGLRGRTLSADDRAGIQDLYGLGHETGALSGTVFSDIGGQGMIVGAVHRESGETITAVCGGRAGLANSQWEMHRLEPGEYLVFTFPVDDVGFGMLPQDFDSAFTNVDNVFRPRFYREGHPEGAGRLADATVVTVEAGVMTAGLEIVPPQMVVSRNLYYSSRIATSIGRGAALITQPVQMLYYGYSLWSDQPGLLGPAGNTLGAPELTTTWSSPKGIGGESVGHWGTEAVIGAGRKGALLTLFVEHSDDEVDFLPGAVELGIDFDLPAWPGDALTIY